MVFQYLVYFSYFLNPFLPCPSITGPGGSLKTLISLARAQLFTGKAKAIKSLAYTGHLSLYTHKYLKPIPISWIIS